jgi:hypothetical protein
MPPKKKPTTPKLSTPCQRQLEMDMATIRTAHGVGACGVRLALAEDGALPARSFIGPSVGVEGEG